MMIGKCPLCKKDKKLINSHIIPEGFYSNIYDDKSRVIFSSKSRNMKKFLQKGQREHLLCKECDGDILGVYDKYGIEVIRDKKYIHENDLGAILQWKNVDYKKFKLFHLSILWRAHFAQKMHRGVELSKEDAEIIRGYLLSGDVPAEYEYPIFGNLLVDPVDNSIFDEMISNGNCYTRLGSLGLKLFVFIFGGFAWNYIVPGSNEKDPQADLFLKEAGNIIIPKENIRTFRPLLDLLGSVHNITKGKQ